MTIPKIFFTYWEGNQLSRLHWFCVYSLLIYNPNIKIILYTSSSESNRLISWNSNEHKDKIYNNLITLSDIHNIDTGRINLIAIDFPKQYDIDNNLSVVYKADFVRIAKLYEHGGVWFDMDILFIKSFPNYLFESNVDFYYFTYSDTIPTGLLLSSAGYPYIEKLYERALDILRRKQEGEYQIVGPNLWRDYFRDYRHLLNNSVCLSTSIIYPYDWRDFNLFFHTTDMSYIKEDTVGIHWFNGSGIAKDFINNYLESRLSLDGTVIERFLYKIIHFSY